jgi:hypothetical protein
MCILGIVLNTQIHVGAKYNVFYIKAGIAYSNHPPWLWSASELCRPSDRRFLAK